METEAIDPAVAAVAEEMRLLVQREVNAQPDINHMLAEIVFRTSRTPASSVWSAFLKRDFLFWIMILADKNYLELTGENVDIETQFEASNLVIGVSLLEINVLKNCYGDKPTLSPIILDDPLYFKKFESMLVEILA